MSIALTGITCGSFAWFMYDARARIEEFHGVTIGVGNLEVGFVLENELPDAEQYGLIKDDSYEDQLIYWFNGHNMESETINYVLSSYGYATDTLFPVTTRKYSSEDEFALFSTPLMDDETDEKAAKEGRVYLPLVFRYADILEENQYYSNQDIFLSQVKLAAVSENSQIHKAVRIFTDSKTGNHHLINPSSSENGATDVGGVLDMNGDGFYDAKPSDETRYEHIYGQVKEFKYKEYPESDDTVISPDLRTTFYAGHRQGIYALESCVPEVAEYEGFYGFRNKRKSVTTTNPLTDNLAYLNLSIFVEGWDIHVIDSEIEIPFSMELKFEVDF